MKHKIVQKKINILKTKLNDGNNLREVGCCASYKHIFIYVMVIWVKDDPAHLLLPDPRLLRP